MTGRRQGELESSINCGTEEVLAKVIKAAIPEVVSIRSFRMETR